MAERLALQRVAEVLDSASKHAFHSKRGALAVPDLRLAGGAPGHGDASAPLPQLLHVPDAANLLCRAEMELAITKAMSLARLPGAPVEVGVAPHWLAVGGVQPATVENAQPRRAAAPTRAAQEPGVTLMRSGPATASGAAASGLAAEAGCGNASAALPLKHSMSEEMQLYFDVVRRALQSKTRAPGLEARAHAVAASLATDPGLQPMLPHLVPLVADEIGAHLGDAEQLRVIFGAMRGLLRNSDLNLLPYIHHLIPAILTCIVGRSIGSNEDHWSVRDEAASLMALLAQQSHHHSDFLAVALARVQQALASALFADAPATQYGALVGLTAFGVPVLLCTVAPQLEHYSHLFDEEQQTYENLRVRTALMVAIGQCMSWRGGALAPALLQAAPDAKFQAALQAVAPASEVHL